MKKKCEFNKTSLINYPLGICVVDKHENIVFANKSLSNLIDYKIEEIINRQPYVFIDKKSVRAINKSFLKKEEIIKINKNFNLIKKDGKKVSYSLKIFRDFDINGNYNFTIAEISYTANKITEKENENFEKLLSDSSESIILFEKNGQINEVNKKACDNFGICREEFLKMNMYHLFPDIISKVIEINDAKISNFKINEKYARNIETEYKSEVILIPLNFNNKKKVLAIIFNSPENCKKELDEKKDENFNTVISDKIKKLEEMNNDLETFIYSVAHELMAPLRHISYFTGLISQEFGINLNNQTGSHFKKINEITDNMKDLIYNLMNLFKITKDNLIYMRINLNKMINDIIEQFTCEIKNRDIVWKISRFPKVVCDQTMIRVVFMNLISNALKYSSKNKKAVIQIDFSNEKKFYVYHVKDNGVGFDEKYKDKLFNPFQRLHSSNDFHGNGVGLALTKKIIDRLGGEIWANAKPDKGATFYFSLPKHKIEKN